jgi:hypothetical protein
MSSRTSGPLNRPVRHLSAVDSGLIKAEASRQKGIEGARLPPEAASRAVWRCSMMPLPSTAKRYRDALSSENVHPALVAQCQ